MALSAALLVTLFAGQTATDPLMNAVPLVSDLTGAIDWRTVQIIARPQDAKSVDSLFLKRARATRQIDGGVVIDDLTPRAEKDPVLPRHTAATWVVDFDQKAFAPVWKLISALPAKPNADGFTAFTTETLKKKSYDHGFDLASQVATSRAGDCTEHAVFLAAVMRHAGIPTRLMMGLALLSTPKAPLAFGHMWTEAFIDGRWKVFDAAIPASMNPLYLPAGEVTEEGPSYSFGMMTLIQRMGFAAIELVRRPE